ncbi:AAA family ATPase [Exiguobacterium chiriqhucha]|uniref:AAA family ATPase n=1 Tax=Exiguobacterium chiriqhucha TaxID=1385984 RepID=UPI000496EA9E|nr:AAA family ATPase [Exiguobacterium chiriqhucha]
MIIKKLTVTNFRQFKGEQTINFSQNPDKNITLILGDNTSGKTTLLQAFLWAFYGVANFKSKDSLLNAEVSQELLKSFESSKVSVAIELDHEGTYYHLIRQQKYYYKNGSVVSDTYSTPSLTTKENGHIKSFKQYQVENKLEEILPKDLSIYFLYDTERFGNITSRADVTKSVKAILGLTVLDNMIKHLGSTTRSGTVLNQFSSSVKDEGDKNRQNIFDKLKEFETLHTHTEKRITEKKSELEYFNDIITKKRNILYELEKVSQLQKEKERKVAQIESGKKALQNSLSSYKDFFKSSPISFISYNLCKKAINELSTAKLDKKSIQGMNATAIKDIIERGSCVCGTAISKGDTHYDHLLEEIRYLPPQSIGTLMNNFKQQAETHLNFAESYFLSLETHYKQIIFHNMNIGELEDEIQSINEEISGEDNVSMHQADLLGAEQKAKSITEDIEQLNQTLGELKKTIKDEEEKYNQSIQSSAKNDEILLYLEYAKNILDWVVNRRDTKEHEIKSQLEKQVNYYFEKMYHGKRKVEIDDKFRVNLITTDLSNDIQTDESQGLETVKNFAFISGLVHLAKQKLADDYEKNAEAYPLILDAPFSNADEKHVKNISEVLPNVANQLILIVMAKDWNYAKDSLVDKVGAEYYLNKQSEIFTEIIGVDSNVR